MYGDIVFDFEWERFMCSVIDFYLLSYSHDN